LAEFFTLKPATDGAAQTIAAARHPYATFNRPERLSRSDVPPFLH